MKKPSELLIINNIKFPPPDAGYKIKTTQAVSTGRNTLMAFVGQKVGRRQYKIEGLKWSNLHPSQWAIMRNALEPFTLLVTFTDDMNLRRTLHMYPSDTSGQPAMAQDLFYTGMKECSFNLVDCGWDEDV